jgi:hypothetical protein
MPGDFYYGYAKEKPAVRVLGTQRTQRIHEGHQVIIAFFALCRRVLSGSLCSSCSPLVQKVLGHKEHDEPQRPVSIALRFFVCVVVSLVVLYVLRAPLASKSFGTQRTQRIH